VNAKGDIELLFCSPQIQFYTVRPHMGPVYHAVSLFTPTSFWCYLLYRTTLSAWKEGQTELTWVADYIPRWLTHPQTHPRSNGAQCRI